MAIKHANIFHFKTLQNLPKLGFLKICHLATLVVVFNIGKRSQNIPKIKTVQFSAELKIENTLVCQ
jgi:hypothetical protein